MSEIKALRQQVADAREATARAQQQKRDERLAVFRTQFVAALEDFPGLVDELEATFGWNYGQPAVTLHYRGESRTLKQISGDVRKLIVEWLDDVDGIITEWEEKRAKKRESWQRLLGGEMRVYPGGVEWAKNELAEWKLADEELRALLAEYEARVQEQVAQQEAEKARRLELERLEREADRARLFAIAEAAEDWDQLRSLAERVDDAFCSRRGYGLADFGLDDELVAAYRKAQERVRILVEQREAARERAEQEAFRPFHWYRVHYGVVAGEGEELAVDTDWFPTLHPVPQDGWWWPANGNAPLWVAHVVKVEKVEVTTPSEMPGWCPKAPTEWGQISIPPGAGEE